MYFLHLQYRGKAERIWTGCIADGTHSLLISSRHPALAGLWGDVQWDACIVPTTMLPFWREVGPDLSWSAKCAARTMKEGPCFLHLHVPHPFFYSLNLTSWIGTRISYLWASCGTTVNSTLLRTCDMRTAYCCRKQRGKCFPNGKGTPCVWLVGYSSRRPV
jgi:hypothetical protein